MIHTITAYGPDGLFPNGSRHVFGYYETRTQARHAVLTDYASIHECLYTHIVIEAVAPGVHGEASEEEWFEWDREAWHACTQPTWAKGTVNHSMG